MIYSYGFKNYFGFKEGADVSFLLGSRVPQEISGGRKAATILGVKGANGAGKTNLLKALTFISTFCTRSFNTTDDGGIDADPYFDSEEPSEFYIDFLIDNHIYTYELGVTSTVVIYERLYRKGYVPDDSEKKSRKVQVFERNGNEVVKRISELASIDVISLKSNASLISSAFHYKFAEPLSILP
ncbi:AAA family ATPase, partial [Klebsiella grimontii]